MVRERLLKWVALLIGLAQLALGFGYVFAPTALNAQLGLTGAPDWTSWMFSMVGARFLALGYGMILVFRNPVANRAWVNAFIGVQAIDWLVTLAYVIGGVMPLEQVSSASFLPLLYVLVLAVLYPRTARS